MSLFTLIFTSFSMGNITPKIFYQCVIAVLTCTYYAFTHVIWSTVAVTLSIYQQLKFAG